MEKMLARSYILIMIWFIHQVELFSFKGKTLSGSIEFQDVSHAPKKLEEGSCLNVVLKESANFTPAAKEIANATDRNVKQSFDKDKILKYKLYLSDVAYKPEKEYIVSAVLNIGWCKNETDKIDSGEWIRDHDFLTDTQFVVDDFEKCSKEDTKECHGPKLSLVENHNDEKTKEEKDEDKGKEKETKKDDE